MSTNENTTKRKTDWWIYVVPVLLFFALVFHLIVYARSGPLSMLVYYLGPLLLAFLAVVFFIIALIVSLIKRPFFSKWRLAGFAGLLFFPVSYILRADYSGTFINAYPSSHYKEISKVQFRIPFDTTISVGWGGDKEEDNYHVIAPDQRWAYDLLLIKNGKSFSGDSTKLENYFCYGLPIMAPASGTIADAFDGATEMPVGDMSGILNPFGNYLIIEVAPKEFLFLCHLKPKSLKVKKGDVVTQGQELALVGNSGHTSEPHLHIHLQDNKDLSFGEGIPLYFYHYTADGKYTERGMPTGGINEKGVFKGQNIRNETH